MPIINAFSTNVEYIYKVRFFSFTSFVVSFFLKLMITSPLLLIYHTGGFWINTRTFWEKPEVNFKYKYLLVVNEQDNFNPIVCSSFHHYKDNVIEDKCNMVKIFESENCKDHLKNSLDIEFGFFTDKPIRSVFLLLFYHYELKRIINVKTEIMTAFKHDLVQDVQELSFGGDLILRQRHPLVHNGLYMVEDNSTEINERTLDDLLEENDNRLFSGRLSNVQVGAKASYDSEKPVIIRGNIMYTLQSINYRPGFWEEIRHAWMQYVVLLLINIFIIRKLLTKAFVSQTLPSLVIVPWKENFKNPF